MNDTEANRNVPNHCPQCGAALPAGALEGLCPACLLKQGAATDTGTERGAPFEPPTVAEVAALFPHLEILGFLGKGGMGAVYKARQQALDRIVALKILPSQAASGPGFAERFNREARALAKLSHPNIVAVHEFGQVNGLWFFIMEFVDGLNLRELERAGKLSPREALQIVPQICEALQFAHDEGIVHRDIKPENILLDKKGRVKIADFGIAKIMGRGPQEAMETKEAMGTPHYMAPEQMEKPQSVDHRADIFSLGVVFYEMLTGELPLGKFAPPSRKVRVDVRLDEVVLRALEKEPEHRYQHASQVKTDVDTIVQTPGASPLPRSAPNRRGSGWKIAAAIIGGLLLLPGFITAIILLYWAVSSSSFFKSGGQNFHPAEIVPPSSVVAAAAYKGDNGTNVAGATNSILTFSNEAARLKLEFAEQELKRVEQRRNVGLVSTEEYLTAKAARDIAAAEMKGDITEVARIKLELAETELELVKKRREAGVASESEYDQAKLARDLAAVELKKISEGK